jgi:small subunit ribosomal protein S6
MTKPAPTYDLLLLLDPQAEGDARAKILADARAAISAKGELVNDAAWGDRTLAYPIGGKLDAEYHLLQFHAGAPELLSELDRTLRITDGIMRFRIVKLGPGVPEPPDMRAAAGPPQARHEQSASSPAPQAEAATTPSSPAEGSPPAQGSAPAESSAQAEAAPGAELAASESG